jgi:Fe-S cluster assembly protein SufD
MSMSPLATSIRQAYQDSVAQLNGASTLPFHVSRAEALERFLDVGVPTVRHEEWKYTNVMPLASASWSHNASSWSNTAPATAGVVLDGLQDAIRIEVRNGVITRNAEDTLPDGVTIAALSTGNIQDANVEQFHAHPFAAATIALAGEGILIDVADGAVCTKTIHISVFCDAEEGDHLSTMRVLVRAGRHATINIVESHHTLGNARVLDLAVCSVLVGEGGHVTYVKILDDTDRLHHLGHIVASVDRIGTFASHSMNINAGFVRNDAQVRLIGEQSQGFLFGVSVLDGAQYVDNHTVVDHVVPHCHSEELYKGVYNGSSTGVFNGKIFVRPQAQKTTAYQSSHSLLLSGKAQVNAKPQLEIWADDVKCSHGATTGQLNEDAVFYLQARGLERSKAVAMLTNAFAAEVIEKLPHAGLQQHLLLRLADKLGASGL